MVQDVSYLCNQAATDGKIKVTVFYPERENEAEEKEIQEVKGRMESIILQQIKKSGDFETNGKIL